MIQKVKFEIQLVSEHKFNLDKTKNYLEYNTDNKKGIIVNICSTSLIDAYNKFSSEGLFNLNIRRFIRSKTVDDGINHTLESERSDFWFLNNGLTIACDDFHVDGNVLKLYKFSIVNGGQTTTLISKYQGTNNEEFFIPCKIVKSTDDLSESERSRFFNNVAEATNSQKPIQPRDLKSNAPEMLHLQDLLLKKKIYLEIKRGASTTRGMEKIRNDELAQIIYSFVNQKPGTSRSNKKGLFSVNKNYKAIFMRNYSNDSNKRAFLFDLIDLNRRFDNISKEFKAKKKAFLTPDEMNVFSNGKTSIFALFGFIYRLINEDLDRAALITDPSLIEDSRFEYGAFISNYVDDDIDDKLIELIYDLTQGLSECYENEYEKGKVTSVSNFFKTDRKYYDVIVPYFAKFYRKDTKWKELFNGYSKMFLRS